MYISIFVQGTADYTACVRLSDLHTCACMYVHSYELMYICIYVSLLREQQIIVLACNCLTPARVCVYMQIHMHLCIYLSSYRKQQIILLVCDCPTYTGVWRDSFIWDTTHSITVCMYIFKCRRVYVCTVVGLCVHTYLSWYREQTIVLLACDRPTYTRVWRDFFNCDMTHSSTVWLHVFTCRCVCIICKSTGLYVYIHISS